MRLDSMLVNVMDHSYSSIHSMHVFMFMMVQLKYKYNRRAFYISTVTIRV